MYKRKSGGASLNGHLAAVKINNSIIYNLNIVCPYLECHCTRFLIYSVILISVSDLNLSVFDFNLNISNFNLNLTDSDFNLTVNHLNITYDFNLSV